MSVEVEEVQAWLDGPAGARYSDTNRVRVLGSKRRVVDQALEAERDLLGEMRFREQVGDWVVEWTVSNVKVRRARG